MQEIVLLFMKCDNANIDNFRPISLLSHQYKLFTKNLSTIYFLQTVLMLIENTTGYTVQIHFAFTDFQKAFDSVES